jgi:internalin A
MEDLLLQGNQIADIGALSGMTGLYRLYLDENQITDVTPLAGLKNLTSLKLAENPIEDFSPLKDIYPNLTEKDFEMK